MTEKEFSKHINEIQKFMGLDMWNIRWDLIDIEQSEDGQTANGQIEDILYPYFTSSISFDKSILNYSNQEDILHVIFHEFSHIYTNNTIVPYEEDREFLAHHIGESAFIELKNKFNFINEQQTELLARRFHKLYKAK